MIIYGSRSKFLTSAPVYESCPSCGSNDSLTLYVYQRYAHIFWIPMFPTGKIVATECAHCKAVMRKKELPSQLRESADNLKSASRAPLWMFSGLFIIVALVALAIYSNKQTHRQNTMLVAAPRAGDVYELKTPEAEYTLFKVNAVLGDSVVVQPSQYSASRLRGVADIRRKGDAAYSEELAIFSRQELKTMLDTGSIIEIQRK